MVMTIMHSKGAVEHGVQFGVLEGEIFSSLYYAQKASDN